MAEAHVARPAHDGTIAASFFMDAIGLRPRVAEMCQRIADWGYDALAPNVFHREGRVAELAPKADLTQPGEREVLLSVRAANLDPGVAAVGGFPEDRSMPLEAIEALRTALSEAGLTVRNEVYRGAAHGYSMADTAI